MALSPRSIKTPITIAALSVIVILALGWAWTLMTAGSPKLDPDLGNGAWLMVTGLVAFVLIAAVLVLFSVTQVRERLEAARQSRFIDSVTHELKSPLASLKLALDTLQRRELDRAQRDDLHEMMRDDIERLTTFIDDILEASRIEHGGRTRNISPVQLLPLAESVARRVRRRYRGAVPEVALDIAPDVFVLTDRTALDIVLKNLLDNAVKYSDPPARVRVLAERLDADRVRVSVSDQGIGIPPDQLRRVFQRFYRVDSEAVRARKGTGLGLYVVHNLVRSMGGRLDASSRGPGQGTTFSFELGARPERRLAEPAA